MFLFRAGVLVFVLVYHSVFPFLYGARMGGKWNTMYLGEVADNALILHV